MLVVLVVNAVACCNIYEYTAGSVGKLKEMYCRLMEGLEWRELSGRQTGK